MKFYKKIQKQKHQFTLNQALITYPYVQTKETSHLSINLLLKKFAFLLSQIIFLLNLKSKPLIQSSQKVTSACRKNQVKLLEFKQLLRLLHKL